MLITSEMLSRESAHINARPNSLVLRNSVIDIIGGPRAKAAQMAPEITKFYHVMPFATVIKYSHPESRLNS